MMHPVRFSAIRAAGVCLGMGVAAGAGAQTFLIDTGPLTISGNDATTASPDANGNEWNNFSPGQFIRLQDTDGNFTATSEPGVGMGFGATTGVGASLLPDEGLLNPDPNLLGEIAVESATQDHLFRFAPNSPVLGFDITSVDPGVSLTIKFFASRNGIEGTSNFEVTGGHGTATASVSYGNNDSMFAVVTGVQSNPGTGVIHIDITANPGDDFMFLNAIQIEVEGGDPPGGCEDATGTAFFIDTGPQTISGGDATTGTDANGNQWNNFSPGQFIRVLDSNGQVAGATIPDGIGLGAFTGVGQSVLPDEGLLGPDSALICDLAVESATQDHIFLQDFGTTQLGLEFSSVEPSETFTMTLLSSRNGVPGETMFTVTGATTQTAMVEHTSNDDTLVTFENVQAAADGTIQLTLEAASGDFMFLNAIRLEIPGSGNPGCNDADLAEPFGVLDLSDISAFIAAFLGSDPAADLNDDGIFDLSDISAFVTAFGAGCP